jgi:DNA polymerase III delta subunit
LGRFPKKEISGIEKENLPPFFYYLGNERGLLGDTAKRISESPTRFDLTHHVIGIEDAELVFGFGMSKRGLG